MRKIDLEGGDCCFKTQILHRMLMHSWVKIEDPNNESLALEKLKLEKMSQSESWSSLLKAMKTIAWTSNAHVQMSKSFQVFVFAFFMRDDFRDS